MSTVMKPTAWIGQGANLGDARAALAQAVRDIGALPVTQVLRVDADGKSWLADAGLSIRSVDELRAPPDQGAQKLPEQNSPKLTVTLWLAERPAARSPNPTSPNTALVQETQ